MLPAELYRELCDAVGEENIFTISPLSAAHDAFIYRLALKDGNQRVAKLAPNGGIEMEVFMLNYLHDKGGLPIPDILYASDTLIVMDFINSDWERSKAAERHAADLLARLHSITADFYGFRRDTRIGSLPQPNPRYDNWITFFIEQRLLYMGKAALEEGKIKPAQMRKLEKLCGKIPDIFARADISTPRLIHGDLWDGNILAVKDKVVAFIDPSIYYADPEIELAFTTLFGTFGKAFFRRYNEHIPIRPGFFEERCDIYNLYALLVHARLFGITYARRAEHIIDRFL
ncbi:MAG: fructosamine kinase [Micavibrio sp.]|nr:MAG: fructosamine kinase [Micavibrio sp.]